MSKTREEYDAFWAQPSNWPYGRPTIGPRNVLGKHHEGLVRHPQFEELCDRAAAKELFVELSVGDHVHEKGTTLARRDLRSLRLAKHGQYVASRFVGTSLDYAAQGVAAQVAL